MKPHYAYHPGLDAPRAPRSPKPSTDPRSADDVRTLVAIFRTEIDGQTPTAPEFAKTLRYVAALMLDGWGASDAQFPQQVFSAWGPQAVLRALATAYEHPEHVVSDIVEHP